MLKKPIHKTIGNDRIAQSRGGECGRYEPTREPAFLIKYNINGEMIETPIITLAPFEARYLGSRLLWRGIIDGIWHKLH